jgi:hypothetical protein
MQVETRWHRPGARLDYTFDWTDQLVDGDTIASKAVSIATASAMTVDAGTIVPVGGVAATGVVVWATGGVLGDTARILCTVTTAAGRVDTLALDLTVGYLF